MTDLLGTPARRHFIIVGRVSQEIADGLVHRLGRENIIQARFGTHGDGESTFELFVDGKLDDHPLEQNYTPEQKKAIVASLKGAHVTIVHSISGQNTSSRAMSLLQCLDALKTDWSVETISLLPPHMALTRADRKFERKLVDAAGKVIGHEAQFNASANQMMAKLIGHSVNRFIGVDFHSRQSQEQYEAIFTQNYPLAEAINVIRAQLPQLGKPGRAAYDAAAQFLKATGSKKLPNPIFPDNGIEFISAIDQVLVPALKEIFTEAADIYNVCLGAPDGADKPKDAGIERALKAVHGFHGFVRPDFTFEIAKVRITDRVTTIDPDKSRVGHVAGRVCVLVDDIISSGSTQLKAAEFLKANGAQKVIAYATHGVFINGSMEKILRDPHIDQVWVTDSVPGVINKSNTLPPELKGKLRILSLADAVVEAVVRDYAARLKTAEDLKFIIPEIKAAPA